MLTNLHILRKYHTSKDDYGKLDFKGNDMTKLFYRGAEHQKNNDTTAQTRQKSDADLIYRGASSNPEPAAEPMRFSFELFYRGVSYS